jgi:hypothetical protein
VSTTRRIYVGMELQVTRKVKQGKVKGLSRSAATSVPEMVIACSDKDRNCCLKRY